MARRQEEREHRVGEHAIDRESMALHAGGVAHVENIREEGVVVQRHVPQVERPVRVRRPRRSWARRGEAEREVETRLSVTTIAWG